jgi:hypothetical protein
LPRYMLRVFPKFFGLPSNESPDRLVPHGCL